MLPLLSLGFVVFSTASACAYVCCDVEKCSALQARGCNYMEIRRDGIDLLKKGGDRNFDTLDEKQVRKLAEFFAATRYESSYGYLDEKAENIAMLSAYVLEENRTFGLEVSKVYNQLCSKYGTDRFEPKLPEAYSSSDADNEVDNEDW